MKATQDRPRRARARHLHDQRRPGRRGPDRGRRRLTASPPAGGVAAAATCATIGAVNPLDVAAIAAHRRRGRSSASARARCPQIGGLLGAIGGAALVILAAARRSPTRSRASTRPSGRSSSSAGCSSRSRSASRSARRSADGSRPSLGTGVLERRRPRRRRVRRRRPGAAHHLAGRRPARARAGPAADRGRPDLDERSGRSTRSCRRPATSPWSSGGCSTRPGLPAVFVGFEPLPAGRRSTCPTTRPPGASRRPRSRARSRSRRRPAATPRAGPGSRSRDDYVVTNAHVVAGASARAVRVTRQRRPACTTPCRCCSIRRSTSPSCTSPASTPAALRFATHDPARGAVGAALGYPGGGALTILPAAVAGALPGDRPRHLRRGPRQARDPRAPRRDRPRRQRRAVRPRGRHGRRRRLRRGADRRPRSGYALVADRGRDADRAGHRPDGRGRHRRRASAESARRRPTLSLRPTPTEVLARCPKPRTRTTAPPTPPSATPRP